MYLLVVLGLDLVFDFVFVVYGFRFLVLFWVFNSISVFSGCLAGFRGVFVFV